MTLLEEKIQSLCFYNLILQSPYLSGNMQNHIQIGYNGNEFSIVIDAPFYDMKAFRKKGVVIHTGEIKNGFSAYAKWVNDSGGFGSHNDSEHWVNRVLNECASIIASEIGAIVVNELPL